MSLKSFHIFFITVSVLLAAGMGIRSLRIFLEERALIQLTWSLLAFVAALALIVYGRRFLKKLKDVSYL